MRPVRVLVTGATGFVGQALLSHMQTDALGVAVEALGACRTPPEAEQWIRMPNLALGADADAACDRMLANQRIDVLVHLAARVHVMNDSVADPLAAFRAVNVAGSLALAKAAAAYGVKRFVYVSSIKVHGESTLPGQMFDVTQPPNPQDAYGVSKWEAEQALAQLCESKGMELVVVRPPLVYGPGVKANLAALANVVSWGLPVPLGAITYNRRSLVGVDNLCSCLMRCVVSPQAAGQTFLVSDGHDLSTADLCRSLALAMGRRPKVWAVPERGLKWLTKCLGRDAVLQRLTGSLQVDIDHTRLTLGWRPPVSVQDGLTRAFKP